MVTTSIQYIGKFTKPFGYKGELALRFDVSIPQNFEQTEWVFVKLDGLPVPFSVCPESIWIKDDTTAVLKLEDIDNEFEAKKLCYSEVSIEEYIDESDFDSENFNSLKNYKIIDQNLGEIGYFERIIEIPGNNLMQIYKGDIEILIPFSDDIITKIDAQNQSIEVNTPEGLVAIYLNPQ